MKGKIISRVDPHTCRPPGSFVRMIRRIGRGSVWECSCGVQQRLGYGDTWFVR